MTSIPELVQYGAAVLFVRAFGVPWATDSGPRYAAGSRRRAPDTLSPVLESQSARDPVPAPLDPGSFIDDAKERFVAHRMRSLVLATAWDIEAAPSGISPGAPEELTTMIPTHPIAILTPLAVGVSAIVCTIIVHALALSATVNVVRRERRLGRASASFWIDVAIVAVAISFALAAHLMEIALWALLFRICGEFPDFGTAFDHSAVNYTTLGYGDVVMTPSWRLLGPLEAANGLLMFGVSTAMIFSVIQLLIQSRFLDFKD